MKKKIRKTWENRCKEKLEENWENSFWKIADQNLAILPASSEWLNTNEVTDIID